MPVSLNAQLARLDLGQHGVKAGKHHLHLATHQVGGGVAAVFGPIDPTFSPLRINISTRLML